VDTERATRLAALYAALADPSRLRILARLADGEATGQDLSRALGLTPPTISHHMARLLAAGLVTATPDAQRRIYRLDLSFRSATQESHAAPGESVTSVDQFFDGERLMAIPAQRKKRVLVLRRLMERFDPLREYSEREVGDLLRPAHEDVATIRRELVNYGFMTRERGVYRVSASLPERGATVAQETGDDEMAWFAGLLSGATSRAIGG
jgi:DNA-binding transcriptional ArsR family regulator